MNRKKEDAQAEVLEETSGGIQNADSSHEAATQMEPSESEQETETEGQAASEEALSDVTAPAGRPAAVRSPKGLNLRKGPALSYEVREVLPDGAEVTALDLPMGAEVPGWRLVATGERVGWVHTRFLQLRY